MGLVERKIVLVEKLGGGLAADDADTLEILKRSERIEGVYILTVLIEEEENGD